MVRKLEQGFRPWSSHCSSDKVDEEQMIPRSNTSDQWAKEHETNWASDLIVNFFHSNLLYIQFSERWKFGTLSTLNKTDHADHASQNEINSWVHFRVFSIRFELYGSQTRTEKFFSSSCCFICRLSVDFSLQFVDAWHDHSLEHFELVNFNDDK